MTTFNLQNRPAVADTASVPAAINVSATGTVLAAANANRLTVNLYCERACWVRFYPASDDNDAVGTLYPAGYAGPIFGSEHYTGEISAVKNGGANFDAYITEV